MFIWNYLITLREILNQVSYVYSTLLIEITVFITRPNYWPVRVVDFAAGQMHTLKKYIDIGRTLFLFLFLMREHHPEADDKVGSVIQQHIYWQFPLMFETLIPYLMLKSSFLLTYY